MALDQGERYRLAAEDALQQLDWCIGYLQHSRQLARNRGYIKRTLMKEPAEPLPTEVTAEG